MGAGKYKRRQDSRGWTLGKEDGVPRLMRQSGGIAVTGQVRVVITLDIIARYTILARVGGTNCIDRFARCCTARKRRSVEQETALHI